MAEQMTKAEAMEIVAKEEARRLKKNAALAAWRVKNKTKYNTYIKTWRAARKEKLEAAKALLEQ